MSGPAIFRGDNVFGESFAGCGVSLNGWSVESTRCPQAVDV